MAVPLIVIGISIALSAAASIYALHLASKQKKNTLSPQTLDSFGITQAREGSVVPAIYGRVRLPGNIIYYGNLITTEIRMQAEGGGKGFGGGEEQVAGYKYFLDVWETIAAVKTGYVNLVDTYVNDNREAVETAETLYNNGTTEISPSAYVTDANKLGSIVHIFYRRLDLGDNTTQVPTIHFIVERILATGLPSENLANGSNPAAIIYDLLLMAGVAANEIDFNSFSNSATFLASKGYGLNLILSEQKNLHECINTVFAQVDGTFFINSSGKYAIQAFDPSQAVTKAITTKDFYEFSLQRPSYSQLPNFLRASFIDQAQDFSERMTSPFVSDAGIQSAGRVIEKSFDLKGFRDIVTAQKRLAEIAKYNIYPVSKIDFSTNFKYASLSPGEVIEAQYDDLGITSAKFRIDSVDFPSVDSLMLKIKSTQVAEALFDFNYAAFSGSEYSRNPAIPSAVVRYRTEFVLPYNPTYKSVPHRIFLIERAQEFENGCMVQARSGSAPSGPPYNAGADAANGYFNVGFLRSFSKMSYLWQQPQYDPGYFDETYTIDDGADGIVIMTRAYPLDLTQWPDISRAEMFSKNRFLFVGILDTPGSPPPTFACKYLKGELIAFQTLAAIANPDPINYPSPTWQFYRIKNFLRGALYTQKQTYDDSDSDYPPVCFLCSIADNVLPQDQCAAYRVLLPNAINKLASPADNHPYFPLLTDGYNASFAIKETTANYGPFAPENICGAGRIQATRTGSNIVVKYYPATYGSPGAGMGNPDEITDSAIFSYAGTLYFEHGSTLVQKISPDVDYAFISAGAVTLKVYQRLLGILNNAVYGELIIDTAEGEYVAYTERVE